MGRDYLIQATVTIYVQVVGSTLQMQRKNEAHQSEVMIAVQMANEDMIDSMKVGLHTHELHLGSFATINQERSILNLDELSSWMSSVSGHSSA